jgi:hypothetical protein
MTNPELRGSFHAAEEDKYGMYIDLLMRMHEQQPAGGHDAVALQVSERARARLLLEAAVIPSAAPWLVRAGDRQGRRVLLSRYLRAYRAAAPLDVEEVDRWLPLLAAARLSEDIDEERLTLLRLAGPLRSGVPAA